MQFGQWVSSNRKKQDFTQLELSELANVSTTYISEIERDIRVPSRDVVVRISEALNMPSREALALAGYISSDEYEVESDDVVIAAYYRGLPPEAKSAAAQIIKALYSEHLRDQVQRETKIHTQDKPGE